MSTAADMVPLEGLWTGPMVEVLTCSLGALDSPEKARIFIMEHVCCECLLGPTQAARSALSACFKPGCFMLLWPPIPVQGCCAAAVVKHSSSAGRGLIVVLL